MSITIHQIRLAANDLLGLKAPNVKLALQIAGCSSQQSLSGNGRMARVLAKYVDTPLPERSELKKELKKEKVGILPNHLDAIYWAEYLDEQGLLEPIEIWVNSQSTTHVLPSDYNYNEQKFVRSYIYDLYHPTVDDETGATKGYGLGYKTISFAMLLLCPFGLELAVLDRHHLNRMNKTVQTVGYGPTYIKIEQELRNERDASIYSDTSLGLFGWLKWEEWRQLVGASEADSDEVESHANLNCRWY